MLWQIKTMWSCHIESIYHNYVCNDNVLTCNKEKCYDIEKGEEVCFMDTNLNVAIAPKDSTFQVRINSDIKKAVASCVGLCPDCIP